MKYLRLLIYCYIVKLTLLSVQAQQFVTDNYLAMPHGTETVVLTGGARNAAVNTSFSLIPNWEFFATASLFWEDLDNNIPQHFTGSLFAKYMFWENDPKTAGGAIFLGYGRAPAYWQQTELIQSHRNIWAQTSITIPLLDNALSWDLMPGVIYDWSSGAENVRAWGFSYASRLAIYKIIPQSAIVGEIYGTAGEAESPLEYKVGIRWEPNNTVVPAITYGRRLDGSPGPGLEIGVMIFSPRFLKRPLE